MKWMIVASAWLAAAGVLNGKELPELKVLYVGHERTDAYVDFLKPIVRQIDVRDCEAFDPAAAAPYDVVLLDWPQSADARKLRTQHCPLGGREQWSKPTVLLGSAGLNVAVARKLKGGIGCTCIAYISHFSQDRPIAITASVLPGQLPALAAGCWRI
jgi:hypothetical protein